MFSNCQLAGISFAFPDICKVPAPPIPFIPTPFPNIASGPLVVPPTASLKVLMSAGPAHNVMSMVPISNGDEAGVLMGMVSQMIMGPCQHVMGSTNLLVGGLPGTKMTMPTKQNGMVPNAMGTTLVPSQFKVLTMR